MVEGKKTEPSYFRMLHDEARRNGIEIHSIPGNHSAPTSLMKKMNKELSSRRWKEGDEAWIVLDKDEWTHEHRAMLAKWVNEKTQYGRGLALSNPSFEYWLLLHFENANGMISVKDCENKLDKHLNKNYSETKKIDSRDFLPFVPDAIDRARDIARAKQSDCINTDEYDWPYDAVGTTVHRLVEKLVPSREQNATKPFVESIAEAIA